MDDKKQEPIVPAQRNDEMESMAEGKIDNVVEDIVHAAEEEFTPEQYRKILAKIDRIILPLMWVSIGNKHHYLHCFNAFTHNQLANMGNEDMFRRPICGQSLRVDASHLRPHNRYSSSRTTILL